MYQILIVYLFCFLMKQLLNQQTIVLMHGYHMCRSACLISLSKWDTQEFKKIRICETPELTVHIEAGRTTNSM